MRRLPPFHDFKENLAKQKIKKTVWRLYYTRLPELTVVAEAILSIPASEAAVERAISKQGLIHSDLRSRLLHDSVDAQLCISINSPILESIDSPPPPLPAVYIELTPEYSRSQSIPAKLFSFLHDSDSDCSSDSPDDSDSDLSSDNSLVDLTAPPDEEKQYFQWIDEFIAANRIGAKYCFNSDRTNFLTQSQLESSIPQIRSTQTKDLISDIRARVNKSS